MDNLIQCPTCSKKYKLPASPPPTFACKQCGTVMDLSAFSAPAAPVVERSAGAPSRSRRGHGHGHAAPARAGRRGRGRGREAEDEVDDDDRGGRRGRRKGSSAMLWVGALAAVVVIGVVVVVMMQSKDSEEDAASGGTTTSQAPAPPPGTQGPAAAPPAGTTPGGEQAPPAEGTAKPKRAAMPRIDKTEILTYPYPDDVTAEERQQIDQKMQDLLAGAGREFNEAKKYLVQMKYKAAGRLISEFKNVKDKEGMESQDALGKAMVIDRLLRQIDGVQERKFNDRQPINMNSDPAQALTTIRRWNWWWQNDEWKTNPLPPWDPAVDEADEDAGGASGGR